jgi:hypothetical protein
MSKQDRTAEVSYSKIGFKLGHIRSKTVRCHLLLDMAVGDETGLQGTSPI